MDTELEERFQNYERLLKVQHQADVDMDTSSLKDFDTGLPLNHEREVC